VRQRVEFRQQECGHRRFGFDLKGTARGGLCVPKKAVGQTVVRMQREEEAQRPYSLQAGPAERFFCLRPGF